MRFRVEHFSTIYKAYCVPGAAFDDAIGVQRFGDVYRILPRKYLRHIHDVVMEQIAKPPFDRVALAFMPCANTHQREVGKMVSVHIYEADFHFFSFGSVI